MTNRQFVKSGDIKIVKICYNTNISARIIINGHFFMAKFIVYEKARECNKTIAGFIQTDKIDKYKKDQLLRASNSIVLNIAEGNGRHTERDRRNYFINARASAKEVLAVFDLLEDEDTLEKRICDKFRALVVELIKILSTMIGNSLKREESRTDTRSRF